MDPVLLGLTEFMFIVFILFYYTVWITVFYSDSKSRDVIKTKKLLFLGLIPFYWAFHFLTIKTKKTLKDWN